MKLIELHKKWMESGELPNLGLCNSIPSEYLETLKLFNPSEIEIGELDNEDMSFICWGSGLSVYCSTKDICFSYTALRQTIVLLICAMHNEI